MNFNEWCELKANDWYQKNMFPKPTDAQDAVDVLKDYLLGEDWYVNYPGSTDQINTEIVAEIMLNYPSAKYKKYPWYKKLYLKLKCFFTYRHIWEYY